MKTCEAHDCGNEFEPRRSTARFCSATCRQRAARARKAAAESVEADAEKGLAEHGLVKAIRRELQDAGKLETFKGQLALQLARRMANPDESSPAALAKALETAVVGALAKADVSDEPEATEPDDEVTKARRRREEIAAAAAKADKS